MKEDLTNWQKSNEEYLAAALSWLRLRLQRLAMVNEPTTSQSNKRGFFWLFSRKQRSPVVKRVTKSEIIKAAEKMKTAEEMDPPPALIMLGKRFCLSRFELEILLLCVAVELDTLVSTLCAHAQNEPTKPNPTFSLAFTLFDDPAWDVLSPERSLRYWRLIEINQPGAQPLTTSPLWADERIVNYIKGLNYLDDRLTPLLVPFDVSAGESELPPSQRDAVEKVVRHVKQKSANGPPAVTQLIGMDTISKQLISQHIAQDLNINIYRLPVELLTEQTAELETLSRLWQRESLLLPIALYLDAHDAGSHSQLNGKTSTAHSASPLHRFLARSRGFFVLSAREIQTELETTTVVDVEKPKPAEQQAAWAEVLGKDVNNSPAILAGQFNLNIPTIHQIARIANTEQNGSINTLHDRVWEACLVNTNPKMDMMAQRLKAKATWDDIVLPEETVKLLRQISGQVSKRGTVYDNWGYRQKMNRGLGINALFTGESGTGKTMAAEVIANHLQLNLYRIDLSAVVSKYIGETEKNLRQLFDAAEDGGAILFFDEADALFGKRSEVKDSHDRYANIEINYLLQRMEAYRGLAILATNMKNALDQAFVRRLRFIVNFPFPSPPLRKGIWEKVFPQKVPRDKLDFDRLACLNITGGSIHNIALNAAFLAAQKGTAVTMPLMLAAARDEFRKLEHPINEAHFHWKEKECLKT